MFTKAKLTDSHHAKSRGGFYARLDRAYTWLLSLAMKHRPSVMVLAAVVVASSVPLYRSVRQDYLPSDVDEGEFQMSVTAREGTSFPAMNEAMLSIERDLSQMPEIQTVLATAGSGWMGASNSGRTGREER